jgi:hypothetical protein
MSRQTAAARMMMVLVVLPSLRIEVSYLNLPARHRDISGHVPACPAFGIFLPLL